MGEIIAVTGRGGVGKSVCAANISYALGLTDKKVLLIDCDCGMRTLDIVFNIQNEVSYSFYDVATGECTHEDAIFDISDNLKLMNSPYKADVDFEVCSSFIKSNKEKYDYIVLDCTASIGIRLESFIKVSDCVIIISDCTLRCSKYGDTLAGIAEKYNVNKKYLIINNLDIDSSEKNGIINIEEVFGIVAVPPIGICPHDREMLSGNIVVNNKRSTGAKAFKNIATRLTGEKVPVLYVKKKGIFH